VRALADETGLVTDAYSYDAFGVRLSATGGGTPNAYRYTGEQWDTDLGMYFLRARYLDPETGRFHTLDTYEGSRSDPQTLHKYLYAHANPVMGVDPSGMFQEYSLAGQGVKVAVTMDLTLGLYAAIGMQAYNSYQSAVSSQVITEIRRLVPDGLDPKQEERIKTAMATDPHSRPRAVLTRLRKQN